MPVSSIAGIRPLIDASSLPNTNRRRRAWNRFIYRSCLSIVIVSKDIFSILRKKSETPKFEGLLGELKKLQYDKKNVNLPIVLRLHLKKGLLRKNENDPFEEKIGLLLLVIVLNVSLVIILKKVPSMSSFCKTSQKTH